MQNVADIYALSPMQQLMLLHVKTSAGPQDVLFSQIVYRVRGPLDRGAYRRAWEHMVERHPALRTLFVWQDGKDPVQVVRQQVALPWAEHDWRDLPAAQQAQRLDEIMLVDSQASFDLLHPPAMRLALMQLADEEFWLLWSSHHLILDRWCIGILFEEVATTYEAYRRGSTPALAPAPRYRDYISWLAAQDKGAAAAYWREALGGSQARPLPLTAAQPEAAPALARLDVALVGEEYGRLRAYALTHGLTTGTVVNAAWAVVLGAAVGGDDALFGLTVSGRPSDLPAVEQAVGSFINNVPLRVPLADDVPLESLLHDLQTQQLNLEPFQHDSPAQIKSWCGMRAAGPLFDTLVVYQAALPLRMPEGLAVNLERGGMHTGYPLSLAVVPGADDLRLVLTYEKGRVPDDLAEQMGTALREALLALPDQAGRKLGDWRAQVQVAQAEVAAVAPRVAEAGERPYRPPRTGPERALAAIWSELLSVLHPSMDDSFFALGGNSISALQLFALVEERLGQRLPISLIFGDPTLAQMAAELDPESTANMNPVLQPVQQSGTRPPFFYMHGIYGDVSSLRNFGSLLGADQPLYGLEAIGLRPGCMPDETLEAMAARYVAAVREVQPSGPYHLGGYCFGGVLAYEVARQLEELGERTALLAIIEGSTPAELHQRLPIYDARRVTLLRYAAPYWLRGNKEWGGWRLRDRLARVFGRSPDGHDAPRRDAETDNLADLDIDRPESQVKLSETNLRAIANYVPRAYGGPATLFRAKAARLGRAVTGGMDPLRGWGGLAGTGVEVRYVNGTHRTILEKPHALDLAAQLKAALQEAQQAP